MHEVKMFLQKIDARLDQMEKHLKLLSAFKPEDQERRKVKKTTNPEESTPHWKQMIQHMEDEWRRKKGVPYFWRPQYFKQLVGLARVYQAWGVMSAWTIFLKMDDDWCRKSGWSFEMFLMKIPCILDMTTFKMLARNYQTKMEKPVELPIELNVVGEE